ncbi:MAG: branched-chain amino acid ABC transporter permease [Nitriliruptorales bacterium]
MGQVLVFGVVNGAVYGLIALGIVLVYKGSKVLNFAQPELGTLGIFVTWWLFEAGVPWLVAGLLGLMVVAVVSFGFERLVVARMVDAPRLTVAVATVGMMLLLIAVEAKIWGSSPKFLPAPIAGQGPRILGVFVSPTQIIAIGVAAAIGFGLSAFLRRTDFGLGVLAAAQDPEAVRMMGVSFAKVSAFTWTVAGVLAGVAGLLIEPTIGAFTFGFTTTLFIPALAAALIGGLTSLTGAFVGGIAVGIIDQGMQKLFIQSTIPGLEIVVIFFLILALLLFRPQGFFSQARA